MAAFFLDSSALAKRYIAEVGSAWVADLFDPALAHEIFVAAITPVEIVAALTRRERGGSVSPTDADIARSALRADLTRDLLMVELTSGPLKRGMDVAETHGLRGYDAVQLAVALEVNDAALASGLPALTFVSADAELNAVAAAEGLAVENPVDHP